jgi:hypothetical protein
MNYAKVKKDHYVKVNGKWKLSYTQFENLIVDIDHWKGWKKLDIAIGCKSTLSGTYGKMDKCTTINPTNDSKKVYTRIND